MRLGDHRGRSRAVCDFLYRLAVNAHRFFMGKNAAHDAAKRARGMSSSGGAADDGSGNGMMAMSKEFEQAQLDALLNAPERPSWDEFKKQQQLKNEAEGAEARKEEEAQRKFRQELDEARNARLGSGAGGNEREKKKKDKHKKHRHKHKDSKREREKDEKKKKKRKKRHSSDSSSDSSDDGEKSERKKSKSSSKADGPISLRAFFEEGDSDSEA